MLSKAATFKKPIFVSNNYLMGRLVKEYKIGYEISENSVNEFYLAIYSDLDKPISNIFFDNFLLEFNEKKLLNALKKFIFNK